MLTTPLLVGLDGVQEDVEVARQLRRHRRAAGRAVRQADVDPRRAACPSTSRYATGVAPRARSTRRSSSSSPGALHPNDGKRLLARTVVDLYHGEGAGAAAEAEFDRVFKAQAGPDRPRRAPPGGRGHALRCAVGDEAGDVEARGAAARSKRAACASTTSRRRQMWRCPGPSTSCRWGSAGGRRSSSRSGPTV